jgi:hypothetical protein
VPRGEGAGGSGPSDEGAPPTPPGSGAPPGDAADGDPPADITAEEQAALDQLAKLRDQVLAAPAEDVVANHAYGLFELAAIHLSAEKPSLPSARLAIDALGALVVGLGDRLGPAAGGLRDGLSQIRLAFVNISQAALAGEEPAPEP